MPAVYPWAFFFFQNKPGWNSELQFPSPLLLNSSSKLMILLQSSVDSPAQPSSPEGNNCFPDDFCIIGGILSKLPPPLAKGRIILEEEDGSGRESDVVKVFFRSKKSGNKSQALFNTTNKTKSIRHKLPLKLSQIFQRKNKVPSSGEQEILQVTLTAGYLFNSSFHPCNAHTT